MTGVLARKSGFVRLLRRRQGRLEIVNDSFRLVVPFHAECSIEPSITKRYPMVLKFVYDC